MSSRVDSRSDSSAGTDDEEVGRRRDPDGSDYFDSESDFETDTSGEQGHCQKHQQLPGKTSHEGTAGILTPPDTLLSKCEKQVKQLTRDGKVDEVIPELIRCVALSRIIYGDGHWKLAESYTNLADAYLELKGYAVQAEYHSQNARSIMLNGVHSSSNKQQKADIYTMLIKLYYIHGKSQTALNKYSEAENTLQKANKITDDWAKLSSVTVEEYKEKKINIGLALARLHVKQKKFSAASAEYEEIMELIRDAYGKNSVELIPVFQEAGKLSADFGKILIFRKCESAVLLSLEEVCTWLLCSLDIGNYKVALYLWSDDCQNYPLDICHLELAKNHHGNMDHAIEMFVQAYSVATANYKDGSIEIIDTAFCLGQAYISTGQEDAEGSAESYLKECLESSTTHLGALHPKTLIVQDELAKLFVKTDRHKEALLILRSGINAKCEVFGECSDQVADTYVLIAAVYLAQGNLEKALKMYKKSYNLQSLVLGSNHKKTKNTESTINILKANPALAKGRMSKEEEMKKRPRFSSIVNRSQPVGIVKPN